jgi:hypothetical protein
MENKTIKEPKTNLCCLVILAGVPDSALVPFFLFKGAVFVVFAILYYNNI